VFGVSSHSGWTVAAGEDPRKARRAD